MNHVEAMKAYLEGKKIRDVDWLKGDYFYLKDGKAFQMFNGKLSELGVVIFSLDSEYELYEEPKPEPKFKVGDRVRGKCSGLTFKVKNIEWNNDRAQWQYSSNDIFVFYESDLELAEEEWTYPCVVQKTLDKKDILIAIGDAPENCVKVISPYGDIFSLNKNYIKVIATDLKNLEDK